MATHRIPILGPGTVPDSSGDVFFEPYSIKASNDVWNRLVLIFNDSGNKDGCQGGFVVPKNYVRNANLIVVWTAATDTGTVTWDFDYRAVGGDDTESLDQSGQQEQVTATDNAPSTAQNRIETSIALTDGNFSVDDEVTFELFRDTPNDTMSVSAIVFSVMFEYTDV